MIDWDHILEITQKNAVQMSIDYRNNKYTEPYTWEIPLREGVKIIITVKKDRINTNLEVNFTYYDDNKYTYVPPEYCYDYSEYIIHATAEYFIYAIKGVWDYED